MGDKDIFIEQRFLSDGRSRGDKQITSAGWYESIRDVYVYTALFVSFKVSGESVSDVLVNGVGIARRPLPHKFINGFPERDGALP